MSIFEQLKKYKYIIPIITNADRDVKRIILKSFRLKKKIFYPQGEYKADVKNLINCMLCLKMCRFDCNSLQGAKTERVAPAYKSLIGYYLSVGKIDPSKEENKDFINLMYECCNCENCKIWCPFDFSVVSLLETVRDDINDKGLTPNYIKEQIEKLNKTHTIEDTNIFKTYEEKGIANIESDGNDDVFYYIGCETMKYPEVVKGNIEILKKAGIKFSTNLDKRWCCGAPLFNTRHLDLAKEYAKQNIDLITGSGAKLVVTDCPGCADTLLNRYEKIGFKSKVKVIHILQLFKQLIEENKLILKNQIPEEFKNVVYHDPCLMSRNLNVISEPREVLKKIPGLNLLEPICNEKYTHCCGYSGTLHWANNDLAEKISQNRVNELIETGADIIVTACPLCELGLEKGIEENNKKKIKIIDLTELIAKVI